MIRERMRITSEAKRIGLVLLLSSESVITTKCFSGTSF